MVWLGEDHKIDCKSCVVGLKSGKPNLKSCKTNLKTCLKDMLQLDFYWPKIGKSDVIKTHLDGSWTPWNGLPDDWKAFLEAKNLFDLGCGAHWDMLNLAGKSAPTSPIFGVPPKDLSGIGEMGRGLPPGFV